MDIATPTTARIDFQAAREAFWRDGIVKLEQLIDADLRARCLACVDWSIEHPGPMAQQVFKGTRHQHLVDNANPAATEMYRQLVHAPVFAKALSQILESEHVWYFAEELFIRRGGMAGRTPWHQDTSYLPFGGRQWANLWISFESLPRKNALEVMRGSHLGPTYDGTDFRDAEDPTRPLHGGAWTRLPDIEAERAADPNAWNVAGFATEPGDVIMLHPRSLHGGAPVDAATPDRRTLVLRFFGDDAIFQDLPHGADFKFYGARMQEHVFGGLKDGDPMRSPIFEQIR
jgi:ectoine hydroxylase-related dioxygenase (phytanoyl-CoA dioxygenase family)